MTPRQRNPRNRIERRLGRRPHLVLPALFCAMSLSAGGEQPARAEQTSPREMAEGDIVRVAEAWKNRVFLVVSDGGESPAPIERVLQNPKVLFRKRRVGCAVYLAENRLLLTAASVVRNDDFEVGADFVEVFSEQGGHVLARVIGLDPHLNLALLESVEELPSTRGLPPLEMGTDPVPGTGCLVLGNPFGRCLSATLGTLGVRVEIVPGELPIEVYRVRAQIHPGDSGGPVVDPEGRFLGLVTAASRAGEDAIVDGIVGAGEIRELRSKAVSPAGFAVPAPDCDWAWRTLRKDGKIRRAYLGVEMSGADHEERGARILNVTPESPAARAGIRPGDFITRVGMREISSPRQLCALVARTSPHVSMEIYVLRGGGEHRLQVELGEAPPDLKRIRRLGVAPQGHAAAAAVPPKH